MRYNIKELIQHDNGDYWVRINNKELPYVDEDIVLAIKERNKEIERLKKLVITLSKNIQELSCNEEELELLNNILGSGKK